MKKPKKLTITALASRIAKREGKKSQAKVGDVREILAILSDMYFEENGMRVQMLMLDNGIRRAKRKRK